MCRYYAHQHACKHTTLSFAAFCPPASLIQNPCGQQAIWQTLVVEEVCEGCREAGYHSHRREEQDGGGMAGYYGKGRRRGERRRG